MVETNIWILPLDIHRLLTNALLDVTTQPTEPDKLTVLICRF